MNGAPPTEDEPSEAIAHILDNLDDDGAEALRHLAAGRAIYYWDECYPDDVVKEFPDGRRQLVTFKDDDTEVVIRDL